MNQTEAPGEPVRPSRLPFNWRRVGALLLFFVCAGGLWLFLPKPALLPGVTVLPADYSIPSPPLPVPDRWIPMNAGWLWKLRYAVLGKPDVFDIETKLSYFSETRSPQFQQLLDSRAPLAFTNGVRAWILPDKELRGIITHLELEQISRMTLGPGVLATVSGMTALRGQVSQITAGYSFTYVVHKHGESIELSAKFVCSEVVTNTIIRSPDPREIISLHTNLALAANMQIPRGQSVFLYDTNRVRNPNDSVGVLIRAKVQ